MAVIRVPRWPRQEEECKRQPHGFAPRGTLRGGPERSAKETQLPHKKQPKVQARGRRKRDGDAKRPTIITVEKSGEVRNRGPLSKANAWRVGSFLEDIDGEALVFLEKDHKRKAVQAEKRIDGEKERFWLREMNQQPRKELPGKSDVHPTQGNGDDMQEDTPEEKRSEQLEGLTEKVASLEKENGELKKAVQELEAKMALQAQAIIAT